ncbi:hypothetical protein A0H81_03165 [Grifola frondosa]|uniref:Uncharacterized protein n=1 Tax=Grifola frondosa TaxID=5627 RepID=A0A1C7MIB4_GRIFR|nr:hypothetical protein A0H81_03165 [Grifola frondosa]
MAHEFSVLRKEPRTGCTVQVAAFDTSAKTRYRCRLDAYKNPDILCAFADCRFTVNLPGSPLFHRILDIKRPCAATTSRPIQILRFWVDDASHRWMLPSSAEIETGARGDKLDVNDDLLAPNDNVCDAINSLSLGSSLKLGSGAAATSSANGNNPTRATYNQNIVISQYCTLL